MPERFTKPCELLHAYNVENIAKQQVIREKEEELQKKIEHIVEEASGCTCHSGTPTSEPAPRKLNILQCFVARTKSILPGSSQPSGNSLEVEEVPTKDAPTKCECKKPQPLPPPEIKKPPPPIKKQTACACRSPHTESEGELVRENCELKTENSLLKSQFDDIKMEFKHFLERGENPTKLELEHERLRSKQLENKLSALTGEVLEVHHSYQQDMNTMKLELCCAKQEIFEFCRNEESLKQQIDVLNDKCSQLEDDLMHQKLSEAETIRRFQALSNKTVCPVEVNEDCTGQIDCPVLQQQIDIKTKAVQDIREQFCQCVQDLPLNMQDSCSCANAGPQQFPICGCGCKKPSVCCACGKQIEEPVRPCGPKKPDKESCTCQEKELVSVDGGIFESLTCCIPQKTKVDPCERGQTGPQKKTCTCGATDKSPKASIDSSSITKPQESIKEDLCKCGQPLPVPKKTCECGSIGKSSRVSIDSPHSCCIAKKQKSPKEDPCKCGQPPPVPKKTCECGAPLPPKEEPPCSCTPPPEEKKPTCSCNLQSESKPPSTSIFDAYSCCIPVGKPAASADPICKCSDEQPPGEDMVIVHKVDATDGVDNIKSFTDVSDPNKMKVDTAVNILEKPPDGVHVTTTITKSGMLEVITEGPEGVVETKLVYKDDGRLEVITDIFNSKTDGTGTSAETSHKAQLTEKKTDKDKLACCCR